MVDGVTYNIRGLVASIMENSHVIAQTATDAENVRGAHNIYFMAARIQEEIEKLNIPVFSSTNT